MIVVWALYWLLFAASAIGVVGVVGAVGACATLCRRFTASASAPAALDGPLASLSMIVPIKGADAHTGEHLSALVASAVSGAVEHLFAMESDGDPAYPICRRVQERHPDRDIRLVVTGPAAGRMGKQHNLAVAAREARYAAIGSMDADVWVAPDALEAGLRALADPRTGVAYFLPCYTGGGPAGGTLVALYANYDFAANTGALALRGNPSFIIGSLWFMTRATLDRIGGLEQFGGTVSDDAAIGRAVRRQGLRNVLLPRTVGIPFEPLDLRGGVKHLLKWLAMLRAEGLPAYLAILLLWHPIFWSALAVVVGLLLRGAYPGYLGYAGALAALAVVARVACALLLNRFVYRLSGALGLALPLLLVPYELLGVPVLFGLGLFRRTIEWRGRRYRLGPHGAIQSAADVA